MKPEELLAGTARERGEQVFGAPWEARAFAIARRMTELGLCTWDEFRALLIDEVGKADRARSQAGTANVSPAASPNTSAPGGSASGEAYYTHFLSALERLLAEKGIVGARDIEARMAEIVAPEPESHK